MTTGGEGSGQPLPGLTRRKFIMGVATMAATPLAARLEGVLPESTGRATDDQEAALDTRIFYDDLITAIWGRVHGDPDTERNRVVQEFLAKGMSHEIAHDAGMIVWIVAYSKRAGIARDEITSEIAPHPRTGLPTGCWLVPRGVPSGDYDA